MRRLTIISTNIFTISSFLLIIIIITTSNIVIAIDTAAETTTDTTINININSDSKININKYDQNNNNEWTMDELNTACRQNYQEHYDNENKDDKDDEQQQYDNDDNEQQQQQQQQQYDIGINDNQEPFYTIVCDPTFILEDDNKYSINDMKTNNNNNDNNKIMDRMRKEVIMEKIITDIHSLRVSCGVGGITNNNKFVIYDPIHHHHHRHCKNDVNNNNMNNDGTNVKDHEPMIDRINNVCTIPPSDNDNDYKYGDKSTAEEIQMVVAIVPKVSLIFGGRKSLNIYIICIYI